MGWSSQYFTTIIIEGNTPQTGIFIYNGTPALGTLIGAWAAQAGQDAFGNTYVAGLNVSQGSITGVSIAQSTLTIVNILSSVFANGTINASQINQGQILETTIIFDGGGGMLFGYTSSTTTVTQSVGGNYNFTSPITGTGSVFCIGSGAGGNGGDTTQGGHGGGAGECAGEPNYPLVNAQVYPYVVGGGGSPSSTNSGNGSDGNDTAFDSGGSAGGVFANGGNGDGTPGTGSTNSVHFDGGTGGPSSGFGGGASGGNSGNKTAKGNNGIASVNNTHAGSPAGQSGSGTGGAGSDSGTSPASNGGSPGAGGGGAGKGTSGGGTLTKTYEADFTASFFGPDANAGAPPNGLRSTSTMYQGGETAGGGGFNGNQRAVMVFPSNTIASDFSGYTASGAVLGLSCNHTWYNSGMLIDLDVPNSGGKVTSPPSTWPDDVNQTDTFSIVAGQRKGFQLGATVAALFINNNINFLAIGGFVASRVPYDLSYYGYFTGGHGLSPHPTLQISGTKVVSGSNTSGSGADGNVTIIYSTASVLEFALAPIAGTDPNGNAYTAGYNGPTNAFHPGSNPTVAETWQAITLDVGWTSVAGFPSPQYRILPTGEIEFQGAASHAAFTVTNQNVNGSNPLPTAYRPTSTHVYRTGNGGTVADSEYLSTGVIVGLGVIGTTVRIYLDGICPLQ